MTKKLVFLSTLALALLTASTLWASGGDHKLVSAKVDSLPSAGDSATWSKATTANVEQLGAGKFEGKKLILNIKSVHTKDMISFRFEWPDADKSMAKKEWHLKDGVWSKVKADEDRLGVLFEIKRIKKFATKGCAIVCHNQSKNDKDWFLATNTKKEKGDLWHWKAVRSNPAGFTEDTYLTTNPSLKPEAGRIRDAGNGKAKGNKTKDKKKPAYMQDPAKTASVPGSLLTTEAVKITDYASIKNDTVIPGYMVNPNWTGSFADLKTTGVWKDGRWVVVITRKLNTGNEDDLQFNTRKKYPFSVAVFNNSHEYHSYNSDPLKLSFK